MSSTPGELRRDVYRLLDSVLATGRPVEIERSGPLLRIVPVQPAGSRLDRITAVRTA